MRLLLILPKLEHSGAPKIMSWVANNMSNFGCDVLLVSLYKTEPVNMLSDKVRYLPMDLDMSNNWVIRNSIQISEALFKFHQIRKAFKPDIVVSFLDSLGYRLLLLSSFINLPYKLVVSERVDPYAYPKKQAIIRPYLIGKADHVIFQTTGAQQFFNANVQSKSTVIPNPVIDVNSKLEASLFRERDNEIVSVGRLVLKQKRQDILLKAFSIVHNEYPNLVLNIYGDGPDYLLIKSMIEDLELENNVFLLGNVDNILDRIKSAKAFVLSSDYEGIPNALIEAMSIGVPCVSTDCSPGGAALLIKDGINGYLVNKGDYVQLARRILNIIESEDISDSFSEQASSIIKTFSEDTISKQWFNTFNGLL